ncbi:MAG: cytochrome P450, partial [Stackebrandtia sp.]
FALPFTAYSLCEFIGLPVQDWEKFHGWVRDVHQADPTPEGGRRVAEATSALQTYTEAVVAAKRDRQDAAASDDVLTRLATTDRTGGLGDDDLVAMGRSLLVGGYESTKSLISTGMLGLLTHPEQMESLRADPGGIASAVDEFLRYEPPFPRLQERYALQDVEIGGVTIPRGQPVVIDLTAANRDPDRFRRPSAFDVADADRGHVSFGPGIHHCLGATLAKAETEVAVEVLLQRLPEITLDCDPATLHWPDGIVSGPSTLPVRFAPSAPVAARR